MAVDQQIMSLNMQLGEANAQIGLMAVALDTLRQESGGAIQELRRMLAQATPAGGGKQKDVSFINTKNFEGGRFTGNTKLGQRKLRHTLTPKCEACARH